MYAFGAKGFDAANGVVERPWDVSEGVVCVFGGTVEANAHARHAELCEFLCDSFVNERGVGCEGWGEVALLGVGDEIEDVASDERFSAGENDDGVPLRVGDCVDEQVFCFGG